MFNVLANLKINATKNYQHTEILIVLKNIWTACLEDCLELRSKLGAQLKRNKREKGTNATQDTTTYVVDPLVGGRIVHSR